MCEISIVIPVYNVENYVERCLRSALEQDFCLDYEVLIVDDCGTDSSMAIVESVSTSHPKEGLIRIVHHPENKGLGEASNTGIREAKGKYIFFLDSDDWISDDCLSRMYDLAVANELDVVVGSFCDVWGNNTKTVHAYQDQIIEHNAVGIFLFTQGINIYCSRWNKLYNREFLIHNKIHCKQRIFEDNLFDFNVKCSANKIAVISNVSYFYARRVDSITQDNSKKRFDYHIFEGIILDSQRLINSHFHNIPGVYDYYYYLVRLSFSLFLSSQYTSEDFKALNESTKGFAKFVGLINRLELKKNRFFYILFYMFDSLNSYKSIQKLFYKLSVSI